MQSGVRDRSVISSLEAPRASGIDMHCKGGGVLCRQADLVASCKAEAQASQAATPPLMRVQPTSGPLSLPVQGTKFSRIAREGWTRCLASCEDKPSAVNHICLERQGVLALHPEMLQISKAPAQEHERSLHLDRHTVGFWLVRTSAGLCSNRQRPQHFGPHLPACSLSPNHLQHVESNNIASCNDGRPLVTLS